MRTISFALSAAILAAWAPVSVLAEEIQAPLILTPPPPAQPRVNGPAVFGVRPGSPFLYTIPATGQRPLQFRVEGLPEGLKLDAVTGRMTGVLRQPGEFKVVLKVQNTVGQSGKPFRIVVGDKIALTPPMGWNSWNCWAEAVDQDKVLRSARAMVSSGLITTAGPTSTSTTPGKGSAAAPGTPSSPTPNFPP